MSTNRRRTPQRNRRLQEMRRRRVLHTVWLFLALVLIVGAIAGCIWLVKEKTGSMPLPYDVASEMPAGAANSAAQRADRFAAELCVGPESVAMDGIALNDGQTGALYNLENQEVLYAQNMYEKIYPASMTKIMTALLALEQGNLDDIVTISQQAVTLEAGSQVCGFQAGDKVSLEKLVNCLLVYSGNDAAAAIAEKIGGTETQFVDMMNQKAVSLGMTGTHFTNPHGLQDTEHYTTAYDVYLMLNEAMNNTDFVSIIQLGSYTVNYESEDGTAKSTTLESTDHYLTGESTAPKGVTVLGGKTGTTSVAGNCLALITQNQYGLPFISIVTNASSKELLYQQMNLLLNRINF